MTYMARIVPLAISFAALLGAAEVQAGSDVVPNGNARTSASSSIDQSMLVITDLGNVREEPNAQARIITTVPRGSKVTMIGTANGGGWAHVTVGDLDGYMDLVQLRRAPRESTDHPAVRYVEMKVELYSAYVHARATSDSPILVTLPRGSSLMVIDANNGWAHVQGSNFDGYMDLAALSDAHTPPVTGSTDHPAVHYVEMKVELYSAYVHSQPTSDSPILVTLPRGSSLMVIEVDKGWAHVQDHNFDGYVVLAALSDERTPRVTGANQTPSQMTSPTQQAPPTTPIDQTGPPTFQSYTDAPSHQTTGFYEPPLRTVSSQGGTIYERPDTQSRVLGFLPAGRQVSFIGSVGNWAHVVANGVDGFVITSQLR
jgi:uncharacterized protein YgiM (DUF1202 family)